MHTGYETLISELASRATAGIAQLSAPALPTLDSDARAIALSAVRIVQDDIRSLLASIQEDIRAHHETYMRYVRENGPPVYGNYSYGSHAGEILAALRQHADQCRAMLASLTDATNGLLSY